MQRPQYELYDLQNDPEELVNLMDMAEYKEKFNELAKQLKDYQKKTKDHWFSKYEYVSPSSMWSIYSRPSADWVEPKSHQAIKVMERIFTMPGTFLLQADEANLVR